MPLTGCETKDTAFCRNLPLAEQEAGEGLAFDSLAARVFSDFIKLPSDRIRTKIAADLKLVATTLGFDRCLIHEFSRDGKKLSVTDSYIKPGVKEPPGGIISRDQPFLREIALANRVIAFEKTGELPDDAESVKQHWEAQGVKSGVLIPLVIAEKPVGILTFERVSEERSWPGELVDRLRLISQIFGNALERKKTEDQLNTALAEVHTLKQQVEGENVERKEEFKTSFQYEEIVGTSEGLRQTLIASEHVASTDSTVLITGETGTGKELIARLVHNLSRRSRRRMIKVNCAALPSTLLESELFGREKGAYTGAITRQVGRFELAHESTILLDEIGELPLDTQAKLLRVLEEQEFERLGSPKPIRVNVRVIAVTNRDLRQLVRDGKFREDLFYRLNVYPIRVPPLRERREDIPLLTWHFIDQASDVGNKKIKTISKAQMLRLQGYSWPGNVRELRNVIERALIQATTTSLKIQLPAPSDSVTGTEIVTLEEVERRHIRAALKVTGWKISGVGGAAEILDINPKTLESRMKKLGIRRDMGFLKYQDSAVISGDTPHFSIDRNHARSA